MTLEEGCGKYFIGETFGADCGADTGLFGKHKKRYCPICTKAIQVKHEAIRKISELWLLHFCDCPDVGVEPFDTCEFHEFKERLIVPELKKLEATGVIKQS